MGWHLARRHDTDYVSVAQLFHSGAYNAVKSGNGLVANAAVPSYPGTLEYVLHSAGPRFILDLRKAVSGDAGSGWLLGDMEWRQIGAMAVDSFAQTGTLVAEHDAIIFFDDTTPSVLLPF